MDPLVARKEDGDADNHIAALAQFPNAPYKKLKALSINNINFISGTYLRINKHKTLQILGLGKDNEGRDIIYGKRRTVRYHERIMVDQVFQKTDDKMVVVWLKPFHFRTMDQNGSLSRFHPLEPPKHSYSFGLRGTPTLTLRLFFPLLPCPIRKAFSFPSFLDDSRVCFFPF